VKFCLYTNRRKKKQWLEKLGLRQVEPGDITRDICALFERYPDLAGDRTAIGIGDSDGDCQSWWGDWGWWKKLPEMPQK